MKKILTVVLIIIGIVLLTGCNNDEIVANKLIIRTTSFPGYDFARAIAKDKANIKMLLKPGSEMHDFEPTPQDIKDIKNSDIFIYVGGESDEWIDDILDDVDTSKTKIIKLMDLVNIVEEEQVEGMEEESKEEESEETEYDEHIWTSPMNAVTIINKIKDEIIELDKDNKEVYEENANNYVDKLLVIDSQIREIVANSKRKELIFGDRFPLRYFVDEYNLSYYAAFPGCSEQTEASAKTLTFLINKVKEDHIPVVFHIELSSGKIANAISSETGAKVLEFKSAHNILQKDFESGITYIDIMNDNIKVLKEALN
jgi:zinc transport system substrate-binding protein